MSCQLIKNKRGVSEIVTTSLLIMIGVALVSAIFVYTMSYAKKPINLSPENCINFQSSPPITIESACYNGLTKKAEVKLRRGIDNLDISSLQLAVSSSSNSRVLQCSKCNTCKVLASGEQKMYYVNSENKPESLKLIINECEAGSVKRVEKC